jgi:hypothetical protein
MRVDDILGDSLHHQRSIVRNTIDNVCVKLHDEGKIISATERVTLRNKGQMSQKEFDQYAPLPNMYMIGCFYVNTSSPEGRAIYKWFERKYDQENRLVHEIEAQESSQSPESSHD